MKRNKPVLNNSQPNGNETNFENSNEKTDRWIAASLAKTEKEPTVCEKIVCHLGHYANTEKDIFGMPFGMTQDGIGIACGITRNHAGIELNNLLKLGIVETKKAHVFKCKTIRKVYFLSNKGINYCNELSKRIDFEKIVPLKTEKETKNEIDDCFKKVLRCALELYSSKNENKPVPKHVAVDLMDVVKVLRRR